MRVLMLSACIHRLVSRVREYREPEYLHAGPHDPKIEAGKIVSHAARYYERVRYAVDYKEEHLLRRSAIERMLKRRIVIDYEIRKIGEALIIELIQAGYLPNETLPESITGKVQAIVDRARRLINHTALFVSGSDFVDSRDRVIGLAASEIEEMLFPGVLEEATVEAFYNAIKPHVHILDAHLSEHERDVQIYLSVHRSLLQSDDTTLFYKLWLMYYPEWTTMNSDEEFTWIASEFLSAQEHIGNQLNHVLQARLIPKLKNDTIYFSFIMEILKKHGGEAEAILSDEDKMSEEVYQLAVEKYKEEESRIKKSSWRALIYIFITKIILAFVLELPYDLFFEEAINYLALGVNIVFHPLLLFVITRSVSVYSKGNTSRIISGVRDHLYNGGHIPLNLRLKNKGGFLRYAAFALYGLFFMLSFGAIIGVLDKLGFNIVGMLLFVLFLTFVSFFGIRIRYRAKTWIVRTGDERFWAFVWDLLTLPIVALGRWLTQKFATINIFVFIMDFIIETPFKMLLGILDSFSTFIKEKKEEFY